jgi:FkbM family methyltransferase
MARLIGHIRTYENWFLHYRNRWGWGVVPGERLELRLRNGLRQLVRAKTNDLAISRGVFVESCYLPPTLEIAEDAVVIDVGAQIGCFSLFAALRATKGKVFAFEPEPSNWELLGENVRRNGLRNVELINAAVAGTAGKRTFHLAPDAGGTGAHSLSPTGGSRSLEVDCVTLPDVCAKHGLETIDFLKLDCEGAEIEILENLDDAFLGRIRQIAMEVHDPAGAGPQLERLRRAGFQDLPRLRQNFRYFRRNG